MRMGILLLIVLAIIISKWLGSKRYTETQQPIKWLLFLLLFLAALLIPFFFWRTMAYQGFFDCSHMQPFVSFLTSVVLLSFFLRRCTEDDTITHNESDMSGGLLFPEVPQGQRDNLKKIEGIGPKIQELLYTGGIYTFSQLAQVEHGKIKDILVAAGDNFKQHDPVTWPLQAKMAHDGKWTQLAKWQDELKGGRL